MTEQLYSKYVSKFYEATHSGFPDSGKTVGAIFTVRAALEAGLRDDPYFENTTLA